MNLLTHQDAEYTEKRFLNRQDAKSAKLMDVKTAGLGLWFLNRSFLVSLASWRFRNLSWRSWRLGGSTMEYQA